MARINDKMSLDEAALDQIVGGAGNFLPICKNHRWVFTGSYTDASSSTTWNYYKCSKCNSEKTERA